MKSPENMKAAILTISDRGSRGERADTSGPSLRGELQPRSFGGKFAMLALNIRNIVILITIANNTPMNMRDKFNPLDEPGK